MRINKIIISFIAAMFLTNFALATEITGAGSSFVAPLMTKWSETYKAKTGDSLNYQSIGSGAGINQIKAKTVDFGATDNPMKGEDLDSLGMVQFPDVVGGIVQIFNIPGFKAGELVLDGVTSAMIFSGEITKWSDAKIAALNPGKKLPDQTITVVTRSDGSGTTAIFTDYLSAVSSSWKEKVGSGGTVNWPAASNTGGKGNDGVAANVTRIAGAIGYVEYAYAKSNNIAYFDMINHDKKKVAPTLENFSAAAALAKWESVPGMGIKLVNLPGEKSWPITGASFIVMYKEPSDKTKSNAALKFFKYGLEQGQKQAAELSYVALPKNVVDYIAKNVWSKIKQ
jgi:phosphate transport system substrate-binding protein